RRDSRRNRPDADGLSNACRDPGSGLSGGQKQRLLLAPALYKQPKVLVLDEATSHLDGSNERAVSQALAQMKLTRLIIATDRKRSLARSESCRSRMGWQPR